MRTQNRSANSQAGFTLVELALVISIVGVLLGGLISGASLLNYAKELRAERDLLSVQSSVILFNEKFNRLPGDSADLKMILSSSAAFSDLADSTLIPNSSKAQTHAFGGNVTLLTFADNGDNVQAEGPFGTNATGVRYQGLPVMFAQMIDRGLDDGNLSSGVVRVTLDGEDQNRTTLDLATGTTYETNDTQANLYYRIF